MNWQEVVNSEASARRRFVSGRKRKGVTAARAHAATHHSHLSFYSSISLYLSPFSCKRCSSSQQRLPKAGAHLARQESRTRVRTGSVLLQSSLSQSGLMNRKSSWLPFLLLFAFLKPGALWNVKFPNSTRLVCCDCCIASIAIVCRL